ncbi:hypothetical protein GCM10011390_50100 [Aureimonas endophytica]|uniref:Uncharacterized protein n=1 Tax=Aureimonas endophytica TaxID=2027858 RepID=A0A917A3F9_9HYPH|nr:hypothetical protein [Aureimonas endophytica]GGE24647.1 hypothetical protein GCM10011390_50100 [Aureimonas endophytica]
MIPNDIFEDEAALDADISVLEAILWSRAELPRRLAEASEDRDAELLTRFQIESMYNFAEFFYLLRVRRIESVEMIRRLAEYHNESIVALTRDKEKMGRLGLRQERLLDAMFSGDTLPRLIQTWQDRPGMIDQSNLARFLVTMMSTETCRKLTVDATQAGFLTRERSPYGAVLVGSTGVMERVFGGVIRDMRLKILASAAA